MNYNTSSARQLHGGSAASNLIKLWSLLLAAAWETTGGKIYQFAFRKPQERRGSIVPAHAAPQRWSRRKTESDSALLPVCDVELETIDPLLSTKHFYISCSITFYVLLPNQKNKTKLFRYWKVYDYKISFNVWREMITRYETKGQNHRQIKVICES